MAGDYQADQPQSEQQQQPIQPPPTISTTQASLSSVRLQHFNYLAPVNAQLSPLLPSSAAPQLHYPAGVGVDSGARLGLERRHYSFDIAEGDFQRYPLSNVASTDYDQTEGLGGVSVSSYDSIDDERIDPSIRGYSYGHHDKHINYHAADIDVSSYMGSSLYPGPSYSLEEGGSYPGHQPSGPSGMIPAAAGGRGGGRGDQTPSDTSSSISPPNGQISTIPASDRLTHALNLEEEQQQPRLLAIEEEKRRRRNNTAASARFRIKKKQRELALERAVQEVTEVKLALEERVTKLEMENRWLKNLVMEKNENLLLRLVALRQEEIEEIDRQRQKQPHREQEQEQKQKQEESSGDSTLKSSAKAEIQASSVGKLIKPKPTVGVGTGDITRHT